MEDLKNILIGQLIGDSFLSPYRSHAEKKNKPNKNKNNFNQSSTNKYKVGSLLTDFSFLTLQSILTETEAIPFQKKLAKKIQFLILSLTSPMDWSQFKSIMKLWFKANPLKSGSNSIKGEHLARVPIIAAHHSNYHKKRDLFIKASTMITHNNNSAISVAQGLGNFISYLVNNKYLPNKNELLKLLTETHTTDFGWNTYVRTLVKEIDSSLEHFLISIKSQNGISNFSMAIAAFSIYVVYHNDTCEDAFNMITSVGGETGIVGSLSMSYFSILYGIPSFYNETKIIPKIKDEESIEKIALDYFWGKIFFKNLILKPIFWKTKFLK